MAYEKQSERILTGGLSLLPPADKLNDGYAPQLENWRSDQAGQLVSRRGLAPESAVIPGPIHTLFRIGNDRYAGAGGDLRKGTAIEQVLASGFDGKPLGVAAFRENVWIMNQARQVRNGPSGVQNWGIAAPAEAPIATPGATETTLFVEFDEAEDWSVFYVGATEAESTQNAEVEVVVTDAGAVAATNGSTSIQGTGTSWTPDLVGRKIRITGENFDTITTIAAVASATGLTINGPYTDTTASGLSYQITRIAAVRNWDAGNKQSGTHSLHVSANPPGRYQVRKEEIGPVDLSLGGDSDAVDIFKLWFYASRPQAIASIYLELYSGEGDVRPLAFASIDPIVLNQGAFSWTHVELRRGLDTWAIVSSNEEFVKLKTEEEQAQADGDPIRAATARAAAQLIYDRLLANTPYFRVDSSFDWTRVTRMVVDVTVTEACDFHLDRAEVQGGRTAGIEGEVAYFVTYANDEDQESLPSPASEVITTTRQAVNLTLPVSPDPQVTKRFVYRIGGGLSAPAYRVFIVFDNVTTDAVDFITNEEARRNNERLLQDAGPPPPARGLVGPYLGRLIAYNSLTHPNRYWWTPTGEPHKWEDANDPNEGSWEDLGEAYEEIVGATAHKRAVWFYKAKTIWTLPGDADIAIAVQTNSNVGLAAERALVNAGSIDYFFGGLGIYLFNGDFEQLISEAIDPIFKGDYVSLGNVDIPPLNQDYAHTCVMGLYHQRLFFSYPEPGKTSPSVTLECDLATKRWFHVRSGLGDGGFTAMAYEGTGNQMLAATNVPGGAQLFDLDGGQNDGGQPIVVKWQSRYLDQGAPDTDKTYCDVVLECRTATASQAPSTLTVEAVFDNGTVVVLGTVSQAARGKKIFTLNLGEGVKASNFAIRVTGAIASTCIIYNAWVHWYFENREGLSFDTGVYELAGGDPADTDVFEAEITAQGPVNWHLSTDLPGNVVAQRLTATIPHAPGRRTEPVRLSAPQTGRRGRLVFSSDAPFQMHRLRQRVRRFGTYVDGSKGQVWKPLPFRLSEGRLVELKDLVVEYEAPSGGTLALLSDHSALRSLTLPGSSIQRTEPIPLDGMFGDMWAWEGYSPGALKLFSAVLRYRPIGVYFDGAKGEFWEIEFDLGQPHHIREFELDLDTDAGMQFTASLELPGQHISTRGSYNVNTSATTSGRRPWNMRGPGNLKGQILRLRLAGSSTVKMWSGRVYVRPLNAAGSWRWINLPIPPTPIEWMTARLPIGATSLDWAWLNFPVDAPG